jgi:FemAB-related protein (PEP-CTERM system-associated)
MQVLMEAAVDASSSAVTIRSLDRTGIAAWNTYVFAHPDATFFHRAEWQEVIDRAFGHRTFFLYAERAGRITGVLPLAYVKSLLFGRSLVSLPFCVYGGIVADDEASARALDERARALALELGADHLEYRHVKARFEDRPRQLLYFTFRKEILPEVEANLNAIPRKQRAVVRKGIAADLKGELDADVLRFFDMYSASVHRLGTPVFARRYFQILRDVFGPDCEVLTITKDGKALTSVLSFYFRGTVLPYYGGGGDAAREHHANDFMYWDLMRRACERGCKVFDYGRSKEGTGAFSFKKNWGFEPAPLEYEFHLIKSQSIPQHNPLNPKYRLMISAWQRLPLPVANFLGPHIVRGLG